LLLINKPLLLKYVEVILHPAISPPVNNTCDPVILPSGVTWKLDEEITYVPSGSNLILFPESTKYVLDNSQPPTFPPVNNT